MKTFLLILCIIFIVIIVLLKWLSKFENPYKMYLHIGKKGSGKTTTLAALALEYHKQGLRVLCTEPGIANTEVIDVEDIGHYWLPEGCVLLIDEIGLIWHSRSFQSKQFNVDFKPVREWFKFQRHNKVRCHCFTQSMDIDKGLRDLCDYVYLHSVKFNTIAIQRTVARRICLNKPSSDGSSSGISEEFYFVPGLGKGALQFRWIPKYRHLFNSYCKLNLPDWDQRKKQAKSAV